MSIFETGSNHPAPVQAYAAPLKSVDPMLASTRGPSSRAQNFKKAQIANFWMCPRNRVAAPLLAHKTVAVGPSRNRNPEMQKSALLLGSLGTRQKKTGAKQGDNPVTVQVTAHPNAERDRPLSVVTWKRFVARSRRADKNLKNLGGKQNQK
ncbi:hypothetical protein B0H13DRAFT_1857105 [Mycena leptocephala]|nr:hypothetical protein B0H13DRAFT_1857105 [Mycena leptocephala]